MSLFKLRTWKFWKCCFRKNTLHCSKWILRWMLVFVSALLVSSMWLMQISRDDVNIVSNFVLNAHTGATNEVKHPKKARFHSEHRELPQDKSKSSGIYEDRRKFLNEQCSKLPKKKYGSLWYSIDERHKIIFCAIPKVASTFFRLLLDITGNKKNPNKRFTKEFFGKSNNVPFINESTSHLLEVYQSYKRALFVRDPWWRVYSAYINKIYMPQVQYWNIFGKEAVRIGRKNATQRSRKCGDDATFSEFVKLAIFLHSLRRTVDLHLVTYEQRCDPCGMRYEMVGKLETFLPDVDHFAEFSNISGYFDRNYSTAFRDHEVLKTTRNLVKTFSTIGRCISIEDSIYRMWTYFKFRGRIDPNIPPPRLQDVTLKGMFLEDKFIDAVMTAYKGSKSKERSTFKQQAFRMAYQTVPLEDKLKLLKIYKRDFQLFGYNPMPYDVFNSTEQNVNIKLFLKR